MKLFDTNDMIFNSDGSSWNNVSQEVIKWQDVLLEAKNNPTLQDAIDQCLVIYNLSKEYKNA